MFKLIREALSEDGVGSFGRIASAMHSVAVLGWGTHYVVHTHMLPDAATLAGLAAFVVSPYGAGKIAGAMGAPGPTKGA